MRPLFVPPDPASRTMYVPGERMQCDLWFPPVDVSVGFGQVARPPVLVMAAGYSRMIFAVMLPSRKAPDLVAGHWLLLRRVGALPRELVWDNESAVGSWRSGRPRLTDEFEAFRGVLGIGVHQCRPRDPEAKGIVERANGYLETSFLPGRVFCSPADFNAQLGQWLQLANTRMVRRIGCAPVQRWAADKAGMLSLPPVPPAIGWHCQLRLPRDHYVRLDSNDYSVDPVFVGRGVEVTADLDTVRITVDGRDAGTHQRCWARQQTITDPQHHRAARELAARAGTPPTPPVPGGVLVEQRSLDAYDKAVGLTEEVA